MSFIKTVLNFTTNIRTTGALYETSKRAGQEVSKYVTDSHPQIIVEYGAGHGNITMAILAKMHKSSKLYVFEVNKTFCAELNRISDKRLVVVSGSAELIDQYVGEPVDCIISTIPFSLIPDQVLTAIVKKSRQQLKTTGVISQILYSTYHLKIYKKYFKQVSYKMILSLPLEFVYHCQNNEA